jgi:hypothetical protein
VDRSAASAGGPPPGQLLLPDEAPQLGRPGPQGGRGPGQPGHPGVQLLLGLLSYRPDPFQLADLGPHPGLGRDPGLLGQPGLLPPDLVGGRLQGDHGIRPPLPRLCQLLGRHRQPPPGPGTAWSAVASADATAPASARASRSTDSTAPSTTILDRSGMINPFCQID